MHTRSLFPAILLQLITLPVYAQLPGRIQNGIVILGEGIGPVDAVNYHKNLNRLKLRIRQDSTDTSALYHCALLYAELNNIVHEPYPQAKGSLQQLQLAKDLIARAVRNNMTDLRSKILRAQIYRELCYRYAADERWQYDQATIKKRRAAFNYYKSLATRYYQQISAIDPVHAYDYGKLVPNFDYPVQ